MEHAKMIKTAKGLDTFFKVMQKISAIAIAVMLIVMIALTVATLVDPQAVIGKNFDMLDVGELTLRLAPEYVPDNATVVLSKPRTIIHEGVRDNTFTSFASFSEEK